MNDEYWKQWRTYEESTIDRLCALHRAGEDHSSEYCPLCQKEKEQICTCGCAADVPDSNCPIHGG